MISRDTKVILPEDQKQVLDLIELSTPPTISISPAGPDTYKLYSFHGTQNIKCPKKIVQKHTGRHIPSNFWQAESLADQENAGVNFLPYLGEFFPF